MVHGSKTNMVQRQNGGGNAARRALRPAHRILARRHGRKFKESVPRNLFMKKKPEDSVPRAVEVLKIEWLVIF